MLIVFSTKLIGGLRTIIHGIKVKIFSWIYRMCQEKISPGYGLWAVTLAHEFQGQNTGAGSGAARRSARLIRKSSAGSGITKDKGYAILYSIEGNRRATVGDAGAQNDRQNLASVAPGIGRLGRRAVILCLLELPQSRESPGQPMATDARETAGDLREAPGS